MPGDDEPAPAKDGSAPSAGTPSIHILRLNHRQGRDARITTHVALTARTLGASKMYLHGDDLGVVEGIKGVTERFGGGFDVEQVKSWRTLLKEWGGTSVHLTMYGERLDDAIPRIPLDRDLLLVVGAAKVPREAYELADFNVSVGNQPHSEVAAVAIFLDRYLDRPDLYRAMGGDVEIVPQSRGKKVLEEGEVRFPSRDRCRDILIKAGCEKSVLRHCDGVADLALEMVARAGPASTLPGELDMDLLVAGGMLHDLGRAVTHDVHHVPEGVRLGREMGLHPSLIRVIARHIGSGVDPDEAAGLGFPPDVYMPDTWEEKLVCLADSLLSEDGRQTVEAQRDHMARKGLDHQARRLMELYGELCRALDLDINSLCGDEGVDS